MAPRNVKKTLSLLFEYTLTEPQVVGKKFN